tara:strand:- start:1581 stop:2435 length:855 start_codon:yes stop_codon:yes gene_type:complete
MSNLKQKNIAGTYKDVLTIDTATDNQGITSTLRAITDGGNNNTVAAISTNSLRVRPASNLTTTLRVQTSDGTDALKVDTTNNEVVVGANSEYALRGQEVFYWQGSYANVTQNQWYNMFHSSIPGFLGGSSAIQNLGDTFGTGSTPEATHSTSIGDNTAHTGNYNSMYFWRLFSKVKIDSVTFHYIARYEGSASAYPVVECEVMTYKNSDGFTGSSGNYTNGTTIASHTSTLTSSALEKAENLTIDVADISDVSHPYKVLVPCLRLTTVGDYNLMAKVYVNYHVY